MAKKSFVGKHPVVTTVLGISAPSWLGWIASKIVDKVKK